MNNSAFNLLDSISKKDYPGAHQFTDNSMCFCTKDLFSSLQDQDFKNMLFYHYNEKHYWLTIYAAFKNGEVKSEERNIIAKKEEVLKWTLSFLEKELPKTASDFNAFCICFVLPSEPATVKRFFVYKR